MKVTNWREVVRNTLRGFCDVEMPSGMIISQVAIHVSDDGAWASPPGKPRLNRHAIAAQDATGKVQYDPVISFNSKELRQKWSSAVIAAVREAVPGAL